MKKLKLRCTCKEEGSELLRPEHSSLVPHTDLIFQKLFLDTNTLKHQMKLMCCKKIFYTYILILLLLETYLCLNWLSLHEFGCFQYSKLKLNLHKQQMNNKQQVYMFTAWKLKLKTKWNIIRYGYKYRNKTNKLYKHFSL